MLNNLNYCLGLLRGNDESVRKEAEESMLTVCKNILAHPEVSDYRKLRLADELVTNKLLPAAGAIECLLEAGFIEDNDGFLLPSDASLAGVVYLSKRLNGTSPPLKGKEEQLLAQPWPRPLPAGSKNIQRQSNAYLQSLMQKPEFKENKFFRQLINHFGAVLRYEDKSLQRKVLRVLPLEILQINAMKKLHEIQKEMKVKGIDESVLFEDVLFLELLSWFKNKFFKWVDSPACKNCTGECGFYEDRASADPQVSRIEIHKCKSCGCENEFPRYTDPEPLLYTRCGRCGEWANCFTLICRTVGYDVRLVYDETDHVWTEVWSIAENRWIHADVCENVTDRPLMYERGWGKKLSYVIAFSKDEMQDVTWRYSSKWKEVLKRRNHCTEDYLIMLISQLNLAHQSSGEYSGVRRKFVVKRSAIELANMIGAPPGHEKSATATAGDLGERESCYEGRTSGSRAWRMSRGEIPRTPVYKPEQWTIPEEVKCFELSYSISKDRYTTRDAISNVILESRDNWLSGVERVSGGVFMKKELDWKMVYLARSPEASEGKVTWTFDVANDKKIFVMNVELEAVTASFNGARVDWEVEGFYYRDSDERKLVRTMTGNFQTRDFRGAIRLRVSALLRGGKGDTAWQHAQLFRQSFATDSDEPSMLLKITLYNGNY